jgi:hypothetical protein
VGAPLTPAKLIGAKGGRLTANTASQTAKTGHSAVGSFNMAYLVWALCGQEVSVRPHVKMARAVHVPSGLLGSIQAALDPILI